MGGDSAGLSLQGVAAVAAPAAGYLFPDDAARVMRSVALQARIVEVDELEDRVARLEAER